jgi:hypothetical protein
MLDLPLLEVKENVSVSKKQVELAEIITLDDFERIIFIGAVFWSKKRKTENYFSSSNNPKP